jgi:hypothetical protein
MLEPFKGFRAFKTDHCVTGSMRHVYEFHDYRVSEDLLLGLGAGVGFIYWHMKGMPPFLGGRANTGRPGEDGLEKTAGRRTGVVVECLQTGSASKAEKALRDALLHGPAMIRVDMGFLRYLRLPEGYHFGGHVVVVAGYDPDAKHALIADRDGQLHRVSMEDLASARSSKFKPFPPGNALFTFDFSAKRPPTANEVRQAIGEVVKGMLHTPISNLGVRGIRKAATCVGKWTKTMSADELRNTCFNAFVFIDFTGGTGGGIFRYMYGRFLKEAAAVTGEHGLETVGQELVAIGDQWQEVARLFKAASAPSGEPTTLSEAARLLAVIADHEESVWTRLQGIT